MNIRDCADVLRRHGWIVHASEFLGEYRILASHVGGRFDVELIPTYESCLYDNGREVVVLQGEDGADKVFKCALKATS